MSREKKRTSPRTTEDGTSTEPTSVQTVTARVTEAIGRKRARCGQECNDNTMSIAPEGTASNNSEPLTRGDIPSLVREIVNTLAEGTGTPHSIKGLPVAMEAAFQGGSGRAQKAQTVPVEVAKQGVLGSRLRQVSYLS